MKGKSLYAVCHVTGYTSEAQMQVFENKSDAEKEFDRLIRNTFGAYLEDLDSDDDNLSYPAVLRFNGEYLKDKYDIYIDGPFDITWDGEEVYERVYLERLLIQ